MNETLRVLSVLMAAVAAAEWLGRRGIGRKIGGATLSIVLGAVLANLGLLPSAGDAPALYDGLVSVGAPVSIFLLLIDARLTALRRAGRPMLLAFALGAAATVLGVLAATLVTDAGSWLGPSGAPLAGMYAATYIGGSANFTALALHYRIVDQPLLFAGANAVDNVYTTVWITTLLVLPSVLRRWIPSAPGTSPQPALAPAAIATTDDAGRPDLLGMASLVAMAFAAHTLSVWLGTRLQAAIGWSVPPILILTTIALIAAQLPAVHRLSGASVMAAYGSYLFLCVIGAYCDIGALAGLGGLAVRLMLFVGVVLTVHAVVLFGAGLAAGGDPDILAIASTANIAGATTVLPLAEGLGRMDLLLPGILAGSLGNAIGTYVGFAVVAMLGGSGR